MPRLFDRLRRRRQENSTSTSSASLIQTSKPEQPPAVRSSGICTPTAVPATHKVVNKHPSHAAEPCATAQDIDESKLIERTVHPTVVGVDTIDVSEELWNGVYKELRTAHETAKLTEIYEKILTSIFKNDIEVNQYANEATVPNMLERSSSGSDRASKMKEISIMSLKIAKQHEAAHSGVKQVLDFVNIVQGIVGSALAAYPPASFVWVGVCAVLPIIVSPSTQKLAMIEGLNHVMERTEWYMKLSTLSLTIESPTQGLSAVADILKRKIAELLKALLKYEMKCVCNCYDKGSLTATVKSLLLDDWKTQLEDIKNLEAEVDRHMSQFNTSATTFHLGSIRGDTSHIVSILNEVKALRNQGVEEKEAQAQIQRLEVMAKFSTESTCPYLDRMMALPKRVPGTCEWFQTHPRFKEWLKTPDGGLLLLSADPGCGKSVLSRFLVEEVLPDKLPESLVIYFFFKDSPDQNNLSAALCALIHQILLSNPELSDSVSGATISEGTALTSKVRVLLNMFNMLVNHVRRGFRGSPKDVVCVLDGLDECQREDRITLVEHIQDLLERNSDVRLDRKEKSKKMRFIITTRGYPDILELFSNFSTGCIRLAGESKEEVDQIQIEIEKVVEHKLEQLASHRAFTAKKREQIRRSLIVKGGEQRTYLWVRLVFEVLESNLRDQLFVWNNLINEVPQTVFDAYDKLLARVRDVDRDRVTMLLRMMLAAYRPIQVAVAVLLLNARDFFENEIPEDDSDLEWEGDESFRSWVIGTCGIFVTIYDGQLFFIHQTAKEFLLINNTASSKMNNSLAVNSASRFRKSISEMDAHKAMAENCLAAWRYSGKGSQLRHNLETRAAVGQHSDIVGEVLVRVQPQPVTISNTFYESEEDSDQNSLVRIVTPPDDYVRSIRSVEVSKLESGPAYYGEFWAQHFRDAQVFTRVGGSLSVKDIDPTFWDMYLAAWQDEPFIKSQGLRRFIRGHDPGVYNDHYTDDARLDFIASYGHYRLLDIELSSRAEQDPHRAFQGPCFLPATRVQHECANLLLSHFPYRPILVLNEPETK